jgi:hypothetical protein
LSIREQTRAYSTYSTHSYRKWLHLCDAAT